MVKDPSHALSGSVSISGVAGDIASQRVAVNYVFAATYKDDRIKDDQSIGGSVDACFLTTSRALRFLNSGFFIPINRKGAEFAKIEPKLFFGLNYEDVTSSSAPGDAGHVFRGSLRYALKLGFDEAYPRLKNLVISAEARWWYDIERSGGYSGGPNTRRLYQYAVIYYFDGDKTWGFAAKRRDGEDPIAGKPEQHFTSIAFTCNFGKR